MKTVLALTLCLVLSASPAWADTTSAQQPKPQTASRSVGKKVLFIALGAAGGFAAGLYFGLRYFDDALYSDRKVWTSVIIGTAAGGAAGALLALDQGQGKVQGSGTGVGFRGQVPNDRLLAARVRQVWNTSR